MSRLQESKSQLERLQAEVFADAQFYDRLSTLIAHTEMELKRAKELQERTALGMRQKTVAMCGHIEWIEKLKNTV